MSRLSKLDQVLLAEAYSAQLLEESIADMSIEEIQARLPYMTTEEAILVEGFLKNMGQRIGQMASGVGAVGSVAGKGISNAANAVGNAVGNAGSAIAQKTRQVGAGVANAAKTVKDNAANIYNTGAADKKQQQSIDDAIAATQQLINLVQQAQQSGLTNIKPGTEISRMTLAQIMSRLEKSKGAAATNKQNAQNTGFTGGIGNAYRQGAANAGSNQGAVVQGGIQQTA
jgi:hypothetical protein